MEKCFYFCEKAKRDEIESILMVNTYKYKVYLNETNQDDIVFYVECANQKTLYNIIKDYLKQEHKQKQQRRKIC